MLGLHRSGCVFTVSGHCKISSSARVQLEFYFSSPVLSELEKYNCVFGS